MPVLTPVLLWTARWAKAQTCAGWGAGGSPPHSTSSCSPAQQCNERQQESEAKISKRGNKSQLPCKLQRSSLHTYVIGVHLNYLRCSSYWPVTAIAAHRSLQLTDPPMFWKWRNCCPVPQKRIWNQLCHLGGVEVDIRVRRSCNTAEINSWLHHRSQLSFAL